MSQADLRGAILLNASLKGLAAGAPARLSGCKLDDATFARSEWGVARLTEWHDRGAELVNFPAFPAAVRAQLRSALSDGLTLYFQSRLTRVDRFLIEGVIVSVLGRDTDCEVEAFEQLANGAIVRLIGSERDDLILVADALYRRVWDRDTGRPGDTDHAELVRAETYPALLALRSGLNALVDSLTQAELREDRGASSHPLHWDFRKLRVLFLSADPSEPGSPSASRLGVDAELRRLQKTLESSEGRGRVQLDAMPDAHLTDVPERLRSTMPDILHFSGHGDEDGALRGRDQDGQPTWWSSEGVARLVVQQKESVRLVVLNACYSEQLARRLVQDIDCVVGMRTAVDDRAAVLFAEAFYRSIWDGTDVQRAFATGTAVVCARYPGEDDVPVLLSRPDVRPDKLVLLPARNNTSLPPPRSSAVPTAGPKRVS